MDWDPNATATDGYVCPPCPVFYPTPEEFKHPLKYISSIRHIGVQAGICKIVPPTGWQPPFAINDKTFRFRTRVQQLNCIDGHTRAEGNFVEALRMFLYRNGTPMQELPRVDGGQLLNLHGLYKCVVELGGYDAVVDGKLWPQVVRRIGRTHRSDRPSSALCQQYQKHYAMCLLAYERHEKLTQEQKQSLVFETPDVQKMKQLSVRSTGDSVSDAAATTPSAKTRSSMKKQRRSAVEDSSDCQDEDESIVSPRSKRVKRTLFAEPSGATSSEESDAAMTEKKPKRPPPRKAVAKIEEEEAVAMEEEDDHDGEDEDTDYVETEDDEHIKTRRKRSAKTASELAPAALKPDSKRKQRLDPPEIEVGQRFYHYVPDEGVKIGEVQRVVRGKKPHVFVKYPEDGTRAMIDLSTMQLIIANGWDPEAAEVAFKSELCQTCLRGDCWDQLLLCDSCNGGHHLFCLDEPLSEVPSGDWYCETCVTESLESTKDSNPKFGFEMGSEYTLSAYKEKVDNWKRSYFRLSSDDEAEAISDRDLEREYWRILSTPLHEQRLEVEYGSDIDSGSLGSGFPRADDYMKSIKVLVRRMRILSARKGATPTQKKLCELFSRGLDEMEPAAVEELLKKYALDDWNLNNLPKMSGSVLKHLDEDIKGVMVPWIYIGMCFSTFCWHVEDHNFFSISYLHRGAPKTWYGVPCGKAEYFESVMKKLTPELFGSQPDLHLQLVTMFSPKTLIKHKVPVYRATHRPNEFIVTFPSAYHGGFNNGFNCAEAVNFATVDWLPWGAKSVRNYRSYAKLPVFAHEALVVSLAETVLESHTFDYDSAKQYLVPAVQQLVNDRIAFEDALAKNQVLRRESMAEFARRYGIMDSDSGGSHSRTCKMTTKSNGSVNTSPVKAEDVSGMKKMGLRGAVGGKMQASAATMGMRAITARPTRMVLWAGNSGKSEGLRCTTCKQYCYLEAVVCTKCRHLSSVGCLDHYPTMCKCDAEEFYVFLYRYEPTHLETLLTGLCDRLRPVEDWIVDWEATFKPQSNDKTPVVIAKKLLAAGLQCGGAPQEKLDELEDAVDEAVKWTQHADRLMERQAAAVLPDLARMLEHSQNYLQLIPDGVDRVENFLGEWSKSKAHAERLVKMVRAVQEQENKAAAFDLQNGAREVEALWRENEEHLETIRHLGDVVERAKTLGQPLPRDLGEQIHLGNQFLRILVAVNEMLAVISRFTKAKNSSNAHQASPATGNAAVIMENDCRHVIEQAEMLEHNGHLPIYKVQILRSLLRVTEAEAQELDYALEDNSKSFEELDLLWRHWRCLPICPDRLEALGKRLSLCKSWEYRAKKLVDALARPTATRPHDVVWADVLARPPLDEAERFDAEADLHFVPASSFVRRQMHSRLQDCRRWYTAMQALFVRAPVTPESPSLPQFLRAALDRSTENPPPSTPALQLHCICDQTLNEHASLVNCVHCQRLFHSQCVGHAGPASFVCLQCRPPPRVYGHSRHTLHITYPAPAYPLFCSCRGPESMSMICCDVCDEWYHTTCIGMSFEEMNRVEVFRCKRCAIRQNLYYLDKKALRQSSLGRRPGIARVDALVVQLQTSLVALPPGVHELLQYLRHVRDVEDRVHRYVQEFAADFSVASFTSLDYRAEERTLLGLIRDVTELEIHLEHALGNLSAIHWSLRACELVLHGERPPKFSHLQVLREDAKVPNFGFPRAEYHHIQQTIEDRVARASIWLKQAKTLEAEEWNTERARRLAYEYQELAQFLELPSHEVELVFRVSGLQLPQRGAVIAQYYGAREQLHVA